MGYLSRYVLFISLILLTGCIAPGTTPTPTVYFDSNLPSYSGILLKSDLDTIQDENVEIWGTVVEHVDDLKNGDPAIVYRSTDRTIFNCRVNYHTGSRIGTVSHYRFCVFDDEYPDGFVFAQEAYGASVSPDERWIAVLGDVERSLFDCRHQVYIAPLSLETLHPMIDSAQFDAGLRSCAVNNINWIVDDATYTISFSLWTGGSGDEAYPIYSITFDDPTNPSDLVPIPPE